MKSKTYERGDFEADEHRDESNEKPWVKYLEHNKRQREIYENQLHENLQEVDHELSNYAAIVLIMLVGDERDDKGSIKVRVSRDWDGRNACSTYVAKKNYLLLDEEGTQIQAVASKYSLIAFFKKWVKTGKVYMFSDYSVAKAADTYRPISGEYVINFSRKTTIEGLDDIPAIPRYKFEIEAFEAARPRERDVVTLMDVVGKLTKYTPIQTTNNGKKNV
ncbi:hypothetical protein POM88_011749 [Heracleum sosnowskyi]|uniref:Replication protein A 70 kDa DNA-binding subunit B/D first OB fold domain-containing protein n=1 Tax=Heracleum sosnowskyi TaxID=360622 RepID=A0AAD8IWT7_9APIA|nr:hypothetical protein POM88_011749 [Heracleum sosnowskyi]